MKNALSRLLWWHLLLIGFGVSLVLFLILFFAMIKPGMDNVATVTAEAVNTEQAHGTENAVRTHTTDLKKAVAETKVINARWGQYSARYMPTIFYNTSHLPGYEGGNLGSGAYQVRQSDGTIRNYGVKDLPTVWGKWITAWYDAQYKYGITRKTSFPIPSFSTDPNDVSKLTYIAFPEAGKPWPVTVECKSFDDAMAHLKRFNTIQIHGMPVVDNVTLAGQSPNLLLSYNLAIYIIPGNAPPVVDPTIGGVTVVGGSGGGFGGGSGGPPSSFGGGASSFGGSGGAPSSAGGSSAAGSPKGGASSAQ